MHGQCMKTITIDDDAYALLASVEEGKVTRLRR